MQDEQPPEATSSTPSQPSAASTNREDASTTGERWKKTVQNHPVVVALGFFIAGFVTGMAVNEYRHSVVDKPSITSGTTQSCRLREVRAPASKWNSGEPLTFECSGNSYSVTVTTEINEQGTPIRIAHLRAEREGSVLGECNVSCVEGERIGKLHMSGCPLAANIEQINCRSRDVMSFLWLPPPL